MRGKFFAGLNQSLTCFKDGTCLTSFFALLTSRIFECRFSSFLWVSSGIVSTPASSSRSEYSSPTPLILKKSTRLTHSRINFPLIPNFSWISFQSFGVEPACNRPLVVLSPADARVLAYFRPIPSTFNKFATTLSLF
jgi:hypothetical protein